MIFEHRVYQVASGQHVGLHDHMANKTLPLFTELGIEPIGFWTAEFGKVWHQLHYIVPYESYADRETRWGAWLTHPERPWGVADDGTPYLDRLVNEIWEPTDYSEPESLPAKAEGEAPWIYEFHRHEIRRDLNGYHKAWRDSLVLMRRHGIEPLGFWLTAIGSAPTMNYIVPFRDFTERAEKTKAYMTDPEKYLGSASDGKPFTQNDTIELWRSTPYSQLP